MVQINLLTLNLKVILTFDINAMEHILNLGGEDRRMLLYSVSDAGNSGKRSPVGTKAIKVFSCDKHPSYCYRTRIAFNLPLRNIFLWEM